MLKRMLLQKTLYWLLSFALLFTVMPGVGTLPKASASSFSYSAFPKGNVGILKPKIGFSISKTDITAKGDFVMKLDGLPVQGQTGDNRLSYIYTPVEALKPGEHTVSVRVDFQGYEPIEQEWTFTIAPYAVAAPPTTYSAEQIQGLQAINDYRALYGLEPLKMNPSLAMAAQLHAEYLGVNFDIEGSESLHNEKAGKPGFVGEGPGERTSYAGYYEGVGEDVSFNSGSMIESIDQLFDAPYHRIPFLRANATELGLYKQGRYVVLEFGMKDQAPAGLVVSPAPGDSYVPTAFYGHEEPDPIRMHASASYPVGYPLMTTVSGVDVKNIKVVEAKLTEPDGTSVELLNNTSANDDHLSMETIMTPAKPLKPDTRYTAYVKVSAHENGKFRTFEKTWSFTTEPVEGIGKKKLHADSTAYVKQAAAPGDPARVVTFGLDGDTYRLDGIAFPMKRKPYIQDGSSYLWVRDLSSALGAEVQWDEANKAAIYKKNGRTVTLYTGRGAYAINGAERQTDAPAKLVNDLTMVPVRLLSEVLGAKVEYSDTTRAVTITY